MLLFTKEHCQKCEFLKEKINIEALGIQEIKLTSSDAHALGLAAYFDIVTLMEKPGLPILVTDNNSPISGVVNIKKYLRENNGPHHT